MILIEYTAPIKRIDEILSEHRTFLQEGYDEERILFSGPRNPRTGGIVVARAESLSEIQEFFANDPYMIGKAANYDFIEFDPVKHRDFLNEWCRN